jgi:ribonuclease T2
MLRLFTLASLLLLILSPAAQAAGRFHVLALSWQPAFCESHIRLPECTSQTDGRADTRALSLHGLWPQREYCGVSRAIIDTDKHGDWGDLPAVRLDGKLARLLAAAMPGTRSFLERHEWIKHGTCFGSDPDTYFLTALKLLHAVNTSSAGTTLAAAIGKRLTRDEIRTAFDKAFGHGAGERVRIVCERDGNRRLITEITIGLYGDIASDRFESLILAARPTHGDCDAGIVDPVDLQ